MQSRARWPRWAVPAFSLLLLCPPSDALVDGHEAETVLIEAEHVVVRPGHVVDGAKVLVRDGTIVAVGSDVEAPEGARRVSGHTVCAGFIDSWAALGVTFETQEDLRTSAATRTADSLDLFETRPWQREALRAGVTLVRAQAGRAADVGGMGALLRLDGSADPSEQVISSDANLAATIGLTRGSSKVDPFQRVEQVEKLVSQLAAGKTYLEQKAEYVHELEDWKKAIAEKEEELEKGFKKAKKARDKDVKEAEEKGKDFKEKKYKEDKKPKPPKYDPDKEVLARVVRGEIPLVVTAHRAAEIRLLLRETAGFDRMRMILAGGTEAGYFAEELAARHVPVIVWPALRGAFESDEFDRHDLALAGELADAGVKVLIGTGASSDQHSRDLPMLAALAVSYGLDRDEALEALTIGAARAFDVDDRLGSIEAGKRANLLVLDGAPLSSTTRVQYVLTGGHVAVEPEENR